MAILAITNTLFYHAEFLADIEAKGSDDGITSDVVAWVEDLDNFYYPNTITASTSTWAAGIPGLPPGLPQEGLVCVMDAGNQFSFQGGGTVLRDLKGNATGGTLNGVTITDSHLHFDGVNDNINFTKGTALDDIFNSGGSGATVMAWVRPEAIGSTMTVVSTRGAGKNDGWALAVNGSGRVAFDHDYSVTDYARNGTPALNVDRWASIAIRGVSNGVAFYLNGNPTPQASGLAPSGTPADDSGNTMYVGEEEDGTNPFDGDLDVVLIWNRQLSDSEIKQAHDVLRQRFILQGMVLVDTVTLTSSGTSLTFDGLNGNADGTYYITGRCSNVASSGPIVVEARPNGLTTNIGSVSGNHESTIDVLVSTSGWVLGGWAIPEGGSDGNFLTEAWIYPEENKGGSSTTLSGRRMYRGVTTLLVGTVTTSNIYLSDTGGYWNEATTNITSLDLVASVGTMDTGTSFSLYYIEDAD